MFTFMGLPDTEKFMDLVDNSKGDVFLMIPGGDRYNLKQDDCARKLFRVMEPGNNGLKITLSNPQDAPEFFHYMSQIVL